MTQIFSQALWTVVFGLSLLFVGGLCLWAYGGEAPSGHQDGPRIPMIYGTLASIAGSFLLITSLLLAL
ncbi:MAG: hypothetical protein PHW76_07620 [Alphaproteobacteria bacterium]|nr:hypothetical protein [Alphaproteobacteria bacterium]